jgi:large subunit ribosomal protein L21
MYAIIETGNKQYRVAAGDTVQVEKLAAKTGEQHTFDRVIAVNDNGNFTFGAPAIDKATVVVDVIDHIRGEKKVTFKMKRRKGYHKKIGHRQSLSVVKIKEIKL